MNENFIDPMIANPEPEIPVLALSGERAVIQRNADRPYLAPVTLSDFLELQ